MSHSGISTYWLDSTRRPCLAALLLLHGVGMADITSRSHQLLLHAIQPCSLLRLVLAVSMTQGLPAGLHFSLSSLLRSPLHHTRGAQLHHLALELKLQLRLKAWAHQAPAHAWHGLMRAVVLVNGLKWLAKGLLWILSGMLQRLLAEHWLKLDPRQAAGGLTKRQQGCILGSLLLAVHIHKSMGRRRQHAVQKRHRGIEEVQVVVLK